jgi:hypothetical protein
MITSYTVFASVLQYAAYQKKTDSMGMLLYVNPSSLLAAAQIHWIDCSVRL